MIVKAHLDLRFALFVAEHGFIKDFKREEDEQEAFGGERAGAACGGS